MKLHWAAILALATALAACLPEKGAGPLPPVGDQKVAEDRARCERKGGRYGDGPNGSMACFVTPRDAGKQCRTASDCESACLARSGTCAPVSPLLGCNEIFNEAGIRVTQCVQ